MGGELPDASAADGRGLTEHHADRCRCHRGPADEEQAAARHYHRKEPFMDRLTHGCPFPRRPTRPPFSALAPSCGGPRPGRRRARPRRWLRLRDGRAGVLYLQSPRRSPAGHGHVGQRRPSPRAPVGRQRRESDRSIYNPPAPGQALFYDGALILGTADATRHSRSTRSTTTRART